MARGLSILNLTRRLERNSSGATAIEFAFVAPVLVFSLLSLVEIGMLGMMTSGVDNAVIETARRFRTGRDDAATSATTFKDQICARLGSNLTACRARLAVSVQKFTRFTDAAAVAASAPNGAFDAGGPGDIIVVKANYSWPLMTPFLATANGRDGPMSVVIASRVAFKNEPYE
jgi:Flp pilus assembly protein TadG